MYFYKHFIQTHAKLSYHQEIFFLSLQKTKKTEAHKHDALGAELNNLKFLRMIH